jgi:hypothetical protein
MDIAGSQSSKNLVLIKQLLMCLLVATTLVQLVGCVGINRRQNVRDGFFSQELVKDAFLDVWGQPDKTRVMSGDEVMKANVSRGGGSFYKGKTSFEVWEYYKYGTTLIFSGVKLVDWDTSKTKDELQKLCQQDSRCREDTSIFKPKSESTSDADKKSRSE